MPKDVLVKKSKKVVEKTTRTVGTKSSKSKKTGREKSAKVVDELESEPKASNLTPVQPVKAAKADKKSKRPEVAAPVPATNTKPKSALAKGKNSKAPAPAPDVELEEEKESGGEEDDEDVHLHGFSTDENSSDEDDEMVEMPSAFDLNKLPTVAKDDVSVQRKLEKAKKQPAGDLGVLFLGRLPHGFYEDQMRAYFSQFGTVTRLRVSRNKKTGKSKHYGFIEFDSSSVAKIVAETMDNYLIMGHILQCKVIPKDQVHPELWVGANRKWRIVPSDQLARAHHNKLRTEEEQARAAKRLIKRQNERKRKLKDLGINYDLDAVSYKRPKSVDTVA